MCVAQDSLQAANMCDVSDDKRHKTYWEKYEEEMTLRKARIQHIIPEIFSPGYSFPRQDTDDDFTITVNDHVSFGDMKDAANSNPQNAMHTNPVKGFVCTVRKFHPGTYKVTVLKLFEYPDKNFGEGDPLVIFHHEKIDPKQIGLQVIRLCQDYCDYHQGMINYINRYDWCHWRNWGAWDDFNKVNERKLIIRGDPEPAPEDESKEGEKKDEGNPFFDEQLNTFKPERASTVFFTRSENAEQLEESLKLGQFRRSEIIPELFTIHNENGTISLAVDYGALSDAEYLYAKVFQDMASEDYFALVVNGSLGVLDSNGGLPPFKPESISEIYQQYGFTTVSENSLKFNMAEFMH